MDLHADWIKARHELSEASKAVHYWDTMPSDARARIGAGWHRAKSTEARRRLRQADRLCREVAAAKRQDTRRQSQA